MQKRFVFFNVFLLVIAVAALITIGIVMLTSTGAYAREAKADPNYFLSHQLMWLVVGGGMCVFAALIDYRWMEKRWWIFYATAAVLLACCLLPHIGRKVHGSRRWLSAAGMTLQPSEFAKLAVLITVAWWYSRKDMKPREFLRGFVYPLGMVLVIVALIVPEVDLGTSTLILCTTMLVMFIAGARVPYLGISAGLGIAALALAIWLMPQRTARLLAFLHPDDYAKEAYQQMQGLIAFGSGGVTGLGLGNGRQKFSYLPFAHTDFILPVVGEELGLVSTLAVIVCFLTVLVAGTVIALRASDRFGRLLGVGIVMLIALQAAMNIGVTTMLLPNKGLPLPFISYGGSSLAFCLASIGILVSIYRRGFGERPDPEG
ncbi:MAG: putative lipid II flippase FtsW, partial [Chthoniobacteraceae bacterium]